MIFLNFLIFIFGAGIGSFLNVLIDRLPNNEGIGGRSYCNHCRHQLAWYDLIPIVSFFLLKGKCRYCGKKISWQYPVVELMTGAIFVFTTSVIPSEGALATESRNLFIFNFGSTLMGSLDALRLFGMTIRLGLVSCLIVIFFSDLKYQIIPDTIQVAFFVFILLLKLGEIFQQGCIGNQLLHCYIVTLLHCYIAGLLVLTPILFLFLVTGGRGMGFGDVKLAFNMGFLLGAKAGFLALYFGFVLGGIVGLILLLAKKKKLKSKIAFGPFLVLGIIIMLFWQKEIFEFVNKIYGF